MDSEGRTDEISKVNGVEENGTNHIDVIGKKTTGNNVTELGNQGSEDIQRDGYENETTCGVLGWSPEWLQRFASKKAYALLYGLLGSSQSAFGAYFVGTISTIEKRYKMPSTTSGIIASGWDVGALFAAMIMGYFGSSGHKTRWVATGALIAGLSGFLRYMPHALFGPGEEALSYDTSLKGSNQSVILCNIDERPEENCSLESDAFITSVILFVAHIALGIGTSTYYTLGVAYLDDNVRRNKVPMLFALATSLRMIGPTLGFLLASYALHIYIDPQIKPPFNRDDTRWVGAWWIGWAPLGIMNIMIGLLMSLFPRTLPREAERRKICPDRWQNSQKKKSISDFMATMRRILKNPVLMFNSLSTTFYIFGMMGYWIFMPKYIETQFRKSASEASLITGSVGLVCTAIGVLSSGIVVSKFRPRPTYLALWNVFTEIIDVIGHVAFAFIGCAKNDLHGEFSNNGRWNLTMDCNIGCNCSSSIKYNPICSMDGTTTFYSPCHGGCANVGFENGTKVFSDCCCIPGLGKAVEGACPVECNQEFFIFILLLCTMQFLASTGRAGNTVIQFRAVAPEDKSVSIAFLEVMLSAIAFIPGPIIFGTLLDSSCLVWGETCGVPGNCWLYHGQSFRYLLNFTASGLILIGTLFDVGVALNVSHLRIYDEQFEEGDKRKGNSANGPIEPLLIMTADIL